MLWFFFSFFPNIQCNYCWLSTHRRILCKKLLVFWHRQRLVYNIVLYIWPKLTHRAARFHCDSWATCSVVWLAQCTRSREHYVQDIGSCVVKTMKNISLYAVSSVIYQLFHSYNCHLLVSCCINSHQFYQCWRQVYQQYQSTWYPEHGTSAMTVDVAATSWIAFTCRDSSSALDHAAC